MADLDEFLNFILFGSAVAWICTGIYVAKPNLHGIKFEEATCNITSVETISMWDELPTCSCGKGCSEEYPCVTVRGYYWRNSNNSNMSAPVAATFHSDYTALSKKCLFVPDCKDRFSENNKLVYEYYTDHVDGPYLDPYLGTNITSTFYNFSHYNNFSCWGYQDTIYFDHSYSVILVYVALIIPGVIFLLALLCSFVMGSGDERECLGGILLLPFLIIGGILACIWEILSEIFPRSCVTGAERCGDGCADCLRSAIRCQCFTAKIDNDNDHDVDVETMGGERSTIRGSGSAVSSRRGSLILSEGYSPSPSYSSTRRSSLPPEVRLPSSPVLDSSTRVSFDVSAPGPIYDVRGSDVLPPPPSYDEAVSSAAPDISAPSYETVVNRSFHEH